MNDEPESQHRIAIVGIGCRVPGANDAEALWRLVRDGVDAFTELDEAGLLAAGVDRATLDNPRYVRRAPLLDNIEGFDAPFFGLSAEQADLLDPQHRLFFECAWEALEDAGQAPDRLPGPVGVFGGCSISSYLLFNLLPAMRAGASAGTLLAMIGNEKDYLATHLSYLLGLTGPSVGVQSACSTSLAAVHLACQSLLSGECDLALAGGASVRVPQRVGYLYEDGSILSPGGHCRSFDAAADGTVFGSGVGVVALRRLEDALRDGDAIHAVILGSALNNDGNRKAGYTAPSVDGQAAVIAEALGVAGVSLSSIGLIEAHGTGTPIGDPIEFKALTEVFAGLGIGTIGIGCVKANLGHLEAAAGVTGLIAASMALKHGQLPPVAHFRQPNPLLGIERTPFSIAAQARPWAKAGKRRAGVSSFGIGGTNVHVVLEQAPQPVASFQTAPCPILCVSARSETALAESVRRLDDVLDDVADIAAAARTAALGRRAFDYRIAVVARTPAQARAALASARPVRVVAQPRLAVLFGDPRVNLDANAGLIAEARLLSAAFPTVRATLERAARALPALRTLFDAGLPAQPSAVMGIALEWALLEQLLDWGIAPAMYAGDGLGELAAAAAAGLLDWPASLLAIDACCGGADPALVLSALQPRALAASAPARFVASRSGQPVAQLMPADLLEIARRPLADNVSKQTLAALGCTALLKLAPASETGQLQSPLLELTAFQSPDPVAAWMQVLADLHCHGLSPDWRKVLGTGRRARLPFYPFERRRHWREAPEPTGLVRAGEVGFPGQEFATPLARRMLCATLRPASPRWLAEHRVNDQVVLPAAAFAALAIAIGMPAIGTLTIEHVLPVAPQGTALQTVLDDSGRVEIHARVDGKWLRHARAEPASAAISLGTFDLHAALARCSQNVDGARLHQRMREGGIDLGPTLRRFFELRGGPNEALARLRPADELAADALRLHPAVLDALFQTLAVIADQGGIAAHLPVSFDALQLAPGASTADAVWCHARLRPLPPGAGGLVGDLLLLDAAGAILLKVDGLACRPARSHGAFERHLYAPVWLPQPNAWIAAVPPSEVRHEVDLREHEASLPALDRLGTAYVLRAFQQLGAQCIPGQVAVLEQPCAKRFDRLLPRLWLMLQEDGLVDAQHRVLALPGIDAEGQHDALRRQHPAMATELGMLDRCGMALAAVLRGTADPLALLFSGGNDDAPALYAESRYATALNQLATGIIAPLASAVSGLNILEIGGGTGGTTQHLLPALAGSAAEYLFTDISQAFLQAAQTRFGAHACLRTALLDIEHDPAAQAIRPGSRHLVIAANVLHATADIGATIAHVRRTLAPGGWLVMVEGLQPSRWLDLTFALTEGWWLGTDHERRPDYPFLDAAGWKALLAEQGFDCIAIHTPGLGRLADQGVIVARRALLASDAPRMLREGLDADNPAAAILAALQDVNAHSARLLIATRAAQKIRPWDQADPEQAAVAGLIRAAAQERPGTRMRSVDLDPHASDPQLALAIESALDDGETDTAWRDGVRHVLRLQHPPAPPALPESFRLQAAEAGRIDTLALTEMARPQPGPDEVAIRVVAAGLNFKDVLMLLGAVEAGNTALGGECAGVVAAVGAGVTDFAPGQRVVALAGGSFASHVIVPAQRVHAIPPALSFEQAAVLPISGMTALHALREQVRIAPGQRVLIHAATGGVGLHCVALAQAAGAQVFATAGSALKRAWLRALGIRHVFDSRSSAFAQQVLQATAGAGVDVVVNSLSGDAIAAGMTALRPGGCFIEIGRAGIWSPEQAAQAFPQVDYRIVALDQIAEEEGGRLLRQTLEAAAAGELARPPLSRFPMADAASAFRYMQQARHIGRIALTLPHPFSFDGDCSCLITGGLGGLGLAVAEWAIARGARHLVLAGRSTPGPAILPTLAQLRALGASVETVAIDVADEAAVASLAASFGASRPRLSVIFHAAGMLDDAPLAAQSAAHLARVRAAKLDAAKYLARHCKGLDALVLFGSAAGLLGSAGQANHSAANAALDAFAQRMHAQGFPVMNIAWGPWAEIGAAAERRVGQRLAGTGMGEIAPADGLAALGWMLDARTDHIAMLPIDWPVFSRHHDAALPPLFRDLVPQAERGTDAAPATAIAQPPAPATSELKSTLAGLAPTRRVPWMETLVADEARRLIGGPALAPDRALTELGLDSLLAIELRNRLGTLTGTSLPATMIFDHPSVRALASHLLALLQPQALEEVAHPAEAEPVFQAPIQTTHPTTSGAAMTEEAVMAMGADELDAILLALQSRHLKP